MRIRIQWVSFTLVCMMFAMSQAGCSMTGGNRFSVSGEQVLFNGKPFKVIGLRTSNALISDETTEQLIEQLDVFKSYGVNTISVFLMGSRFGDVKGYQPDGTLDLTYAGRLARIIEEADRKNMIVLVGCLYWGTSEAKADLRAWRQDDANRAVANTVAWLTEHQYRNVFVDVDNEGMAEREMGWSIEQLIDAAHSVNPAIMVAYNSRNAPPDNADILVHFSPNQPGRPWIESEGTPDNAPQGYWGRYSKEESYMNYIRVGRYTQAMKQRQLEMTFHAIHDDAGYMMASTWLQCAPGEGVGGPFMTPGGQAENPAINDDVKVLHDDAGVRWWLDAVKARYGGWEDAT